VSLPQAAPGTEASRHLERPSTHLPNPHADAQSGAGRHLARASRPGAPPLFAPLAGVVAAYPRFVRAAALERRAARYLAGDRIVFR
jgi:hypothetical protein